MKQGVFRSSPACSLGCAFCEVGCAIRAGEADDAWRKLQHLRRAEAAPELAWKRLRAAARLANATQAFAQARHGLPRGQDP